MALTLDEITQHFAQWRSGRKSRQPIPSYLWDEVADIAQGYSISKLTSRLRISYRQYRENIPDRLNKGSSTAVPITFVSVPPPIQPLLPEKSIVLEFMRVDGALAKCHCVDVGMMRDTLSWFLKGG